MPNKLQMTSVRDVSFDAVKLSPGSVMHIQSMLDETQERHEVRYIGMIKGQSLLVTLPMVEGTGMWMPIKQKYIIRGFNGRHAYAFTAQVIRARTHPFPYVHLSYPQSVEYRQVRHSLRIPVSMSAQITTQLNNTPVAVNLLDLSTLGTMVDSPVSLGKIGDRVHLTLRLPFQENEVALSLDANIRSISISDINEQAQGIHSHVGLEFESVSQNDLLILNYHIFSVVQET